jgi:hypothetical protein
MDNLNFTLIDSLILDYASIRKKTEMYKKRFPKYITGNDNYIGMIGEYWATRFLENFDAQYKEVVTASLKNKEDGEHNLSNEWSDFELQHEDKTEYISVKAIFENKNGESGKIKKYNKELKDNEIASVMIIKLNDSLFPTEILYIKDIEKNLTGAGEKDYRKNWKNNSLVFKFYDNTKNQGFDRALSQFIWKFNSNTEKFEKLKS